MDPRSASNLSEAVSGSADNLSDAVSGSAETLQSNPTTEGLGVTSTPDLIANSTNQVKPTAQDVNPIKPVDPVKPVNPINSVNPVNPVKPVSISDLTQSLSSTKLNASASIPKSPKQVKSNIAKLPKQVKPTTGKNLAIPKPSSTNQGPANLTIPPTLATYKASKHINLSTLVSLQAAMRYSAAGEKKRISEFVVEYYKENKIHANKLVVEAIGKEIWRAFEVEKQHWRDISDFSPLSTVDTKGRVVRKEAVSQATQEELDEEYRRELGGGF